MPDALPDATLPISRLGTGSTNGCKIVVALKRAAARGVQCRAMADGLGSRAMIKSSQWQAMREAGVHVAVALPIGNPLLGPVL
jgi:cardiolipin synthase